MANKIVIPEVLKKDIRKYANNVAKHIAMAVRDDMAKEYKYVVEQFYSEYRPRYYFRYDELWDTYEPYYHNSSPNFYGGIILDGSKMSDELYQDSAGAYSSFLNGYHGHPSLGIYGSINAYEHMMDYRDSIIANIGSYYAPANAKARKDSYSILRF